MEVAEYVVLLSLSGVTAFVLAGLGWRYREDPVGRWFVGLCVSGGLWSFGYAAAVGSTTLGALVFWYEVTWLPYQLVLVFLLLFTLEYTGHERWVDWRRAPAFLAWPTATTLAVVTNGAHHLVWSDVRVVRGETVRYLDAATGPWFVADVVYGFGVAFVCLGLLYREMSDTRHVYRKQTALIGFGVAVPVVVATVHLLSPFFVLNPVPVSFTVTAGVFLLAIRRYHFLDIVPVAHRLVLEHMDDAVVVVGTGGEIVDYNASAARLFGVSDGDIGRRAATVVGREEASDTYTTTVEGELRQFEVDTVEIRDDRDVERGTLYLFHDVTERHRREQWFRTLTENATDITMVLDDDGRIEYVGESVRRVLGVDPAALDHERAVSRAHEDDREAVESAFAEALDRPGETVEFECRVRDADGDHRTFDVRAKNLLFDPVIEGVVVNAHDVTERERNERRLERQNEQLDAFASVISHDLRNPLNVAQGYLDLLRDDPSPEHVDRVERAHERMEAIISEVLTLARSGSEVGETEAVDLGDAAEEAWSNVVTPDGTLTVAADASVDADRTRLLTLFENLFRNSVEHGSTSSRTQSGDSVEHGSTSSRPKADDSVERGSTGNRTPPGDGVEHGSTPPVSDADGPVIHVGLLDDGTGFYVADDGPGIPPEDRERVFESGFSTAGSGTGLGLAIVQTVAEAHGWDVACVAADDGGARFEFRGADVYEASAG